MVIIQRYISYWVMVSTLALVCHYRARNIHKCDTDTWQNVRGREVEDDITLLLHRHGNLRTDLLSAHKTAFPHYTLPTVIWQTHTRERLHTHIHTHTQRNTQMYMHTKSVQIILCTLTYMSHICQSHQKHLQRIHDWHQHRFCQTRTLVDPLHSHHLVGLQWQWFTH